MKASAAFPPEAIRENELEDKTLTEEEKASLPVKDSDLQVSSQPTDSISGYVLLPAFRPCTKCQLHRHQVQR